jgi:hypothetical protein
MARTSTTRAPRIRGSVAEERRTALLAAWSEERSAAQDARNRGDLEAEWNHLERAHILSQPMAGPHLRTHVSMLGYGFRRRDRREVVGQLVRLLVAAPGSWTGRYPVGNTGGANVNALKPMAIPDDLQAVLNSSVITPAGP